ncbi:collectrin isoform X2 [Ascaphus truei]|uniref:collectrin isoform X2 n=1 Tax=Ascaphus truei TaxID=8439 RepID=UPI003F59AF0B
MHDNVTFSKEDFSTWVIPPKVDAAVSKMYKWNTDEEYLFRATIAFTMRTHTKNIPFQVSNILLCNVTQRVSFWFVVTSPSNDSVAFPSASVEAAIRNERNRINKAFLLDDKTLEFIDIPPTLVPITESSKPSWLIVFGVIFSLTMSAMGFLVVSGIIQRRKKGNASTEHEESEDRIENVVSIENAIPCDNLYSKALVNSGYDNSEEALTPL